MIELARLLKGMGFGKLFKTYLKKIALWNHKKIAKVCSLLTLCLCSKISFAAYPTMSEAWANCQANTYSYPWHDPYYSGARYFCGDCKYRNPYTQEEPKNCFTLYMYYPTNNTPPFPYPWGAHYFYCTTPDCEGNPKSPPNCPSVGNPINIGTGNKHAIEVDYPITGSSPLTFIRYYNSLSDYQFTATFGSLGLASKPFGSNWTHNYFKGLTVLPDEVRLTLPTGQTFKFKQLPEGWRPDADINYKLEEIIDQTSSTRVGWKVTTPEDTIEHYDVIGNLLEIITRAGIKQTLTYSDSTTPLSTAAYSGLLIKVTDNFGRSLNFSYKGHKLIQLIGPDNKKISYSYDSDPQGNLSSVVYPYDVSDTIVPTRKYIYGETDQITGNPTNAVIFYSLTGIYDESNVRFATYKYDQKGKGIATEHAGGTGKYSLEYMSDDPNTTGIIDPVTQITDPLTSVRSTHFKTVLGVLKPTGTDQPPVFNQVGAQTCPAAASKIDYNETTGNVLSRTDYNNHKTCYRYEVDSVATGRNLEIARVEGLPPDADCASVLAANTLPASPTNSIRKISTEWHPTYRLPVKIAEPSKLTVNSYDTAGNLLSHSEQATTDPTGVKGLTATVSGAVRAWTRTYYPFGRLHTEDGPRTDVSDITTYDYYADDDPDLGKRGNLKTVSRPLGQVTTYNSYTPSGQPTQITAPNGVITEMAYTPRGWLKSLTVKDRNGANAETTGYSYTPTGLLEFVTLPDQTRLKYVYDDAHRLTDIRQLDNAPAAENIVAQVHYGLDAAGNRKEEEYKDPAGNLKRNISRVYDALNRLQTVTGAEQ